MWYDIDTAQTQHYIIPQTQHLIHAAPCHGGAAILKAVNNMTQEEREKIISDIIELLDQLGLIEDD